MNEHPTEKEIVEMIKLKKQYLNTNKKIIWYFQKKIIKAEKRRKKTEAEIYNLATLLPKIEKASKIQKENEKYGQERIKENIGTGS